MLKEVRHKIVSISEESGIDLDKERFLIIGNSFDKRSLFLYSRNSKTPILLVKIPGSQEGKTRCITEFSAMKHLEKNNVSCVSFPKAISVVNDGVEECYLYSVVTSPLLLRYLNYPWIPFQRNCFARATSSLLKIYYETKHALKMPNKSYSKCFRHGDFWMGNIGEIGNKLVLYDFEFAEIQGLPLLDLLHFGLYYCVTCKNKGKIGTEILRGKYQRENEKRNFKAAEMHVEELLLKSGKIRRAMIRSINYYINELHINKTDALDLILYYIEEEKGIKGLGNAWINDIALT